MRRRGRGSATVLATALLVGGMAVPAAAASTPQEELTGDDVGDVVAVEQLQVLGAIGDLHLYPGNGSGGLAGRVKIGAGFQRAEVLPAGNFDGVGGADLVAVFYEEGVVRLYPRTTAGAFGRARVIATPYRLRETTLPGDFTGDGTPDLIAIGANGRLWLYPGDGNGGLLPGRQIGSRWNEHDNLFSPGDWDGDGATDLVSRNAGDGRLWLHRGDGRGGFTGSAVLLGRGWSSYDRLGGAVDLSGDGLPDVVATSPGGLLYLYRGDGSGGFQPGRTLLGRGWNPMAATVASQREGATRPPG